MPENPLHDFLNGSKATEEFKQAVLDFEAGKGSGLIEDTRRNPPVKILRLITFLLREHPELEIQSIRIEAKSGCSDFSGAAWIQPGDLQIDFKWDCAWRANEQGWKDFFGFPDQIRAAREYGYDCFEKFEVVHSAV